MYHLMNFSLFSFVRRVSFRGINPHNLLLFFTIVLITPRSLTMDEVVPKDRKMIALTTVVEGILTILSYNVIAVMMATIAICI